MLAGPDTNSLALIATTPLWGGSSAGYFYDPLQTIPTVGGGETAWIRVLVWNTNAGATFAEAQKSSGFIDPWGQTDVFSLVAGNPQIPPPNLPTAGLSTFKWAPRGTVKFANFDVATGLNAPVLLDDGVTPLAGSNFMAALLAGSSPTNLSLIATTPFLSGSQAGYFDGGTQSIPTVAGGGIAFVLIEVWSSDFSSFGAAKASSFANSWGWPGNGNPFSIVTGNPEGTPATAPAALTPLATFFLASLDLPPVIHQSYNPVTGTVTLSFTGTLKVSTDLIHWTDVAGTSPQVFPANQAHQYFRTGY